MGCNCKKPQVLNNLKSVDHLRLATETYEQVALSKSIEEYDDFDKMQVFNAFKSLYPNAKNLPTLNDAVGHLKNAREIFYKK